MDESQQVMRSLRPLPDCVESVQRHAVDIQRRKELGRTFGEWIAYQLGPWDWFVNPVSFRDRHPDLERNPKTGVPRIYRVKLRMFSSCSSRGLSFCRPDPCIQGWRPDSKYRVEPGPPVPDKALAEIFDWLSELQQAADNPIKVMVAEQFGRLGGRHHCHLLMGGVAHLRRDEWWQKAFERFGRTRIEPFDPDRGAAFYCAKYAAKQIGALHFVGHFGSGSYSAVLRPGPSCGGDDVTSSAAMLRDDIRRSECYPRGWAGWRQKR